MKLNTYLVYLILMALCGWKLSQTATAHVKQAHEQRAAALERALQSME